MHYLEVNPEWIKWYAYDLRRIINDTIFIIKESKAALETYYEETDSYTQYAIRDLYECCYKYYGQLEMCKDFFEMVGVVYGKY